MRHRSAAPAAQQRLSPGTGDVADEPVPLGDLLARWQAAGIVTPDQARRMSDVGTPPVSVHGAGRSEHPAPPFVVEAVAYLGGVVVVVGALLLAQLSWDELSTATRLWVTGAAVVGLAIAGRAVPARHGGAPARLRSTLWLGSTVAAAGWLAILLLDLSDLSDQRALVVTSAGTAVVAGGFWLAHRSLVQQVATFAALMLTAATALSDLTGSGSWPGAGVWVVAASWLLLGWAGVLGPRRPVLVLASAALVLGALMTLPTDAGFVLAIGTVLAVVVLAVVLGEPLLLAVGAVGVLLVLPPVVVEWLPRSAAVPVVLLLVGLCVVAAAAWVARRGGRPRSPTPP